MSKAQKIILVILLGLLGTLAVVTGVFLVIDFEATKQFIMNAWAWLNDPLPVVGVSIAMILWFLWRIFCNSSFGKKQIYEFKRLTQQTISEFNTYKLECNKKIAEFEVIIEEQQKSIDYYREVIKTICGNSRNAKIKEIGVKLNGEERKETVNNETETN